MKLFLDDIRVPEDLGLHGWELVKTSAEVIQLLSQGKVTELSLDHDLGGDDTGYRVMVWLEVHPEFWPKDGIRCHSANPVGRQRIEAVIKRRECGSTPGNFGVRTP